MKKITYLLVFFIFLTQLEGKSYNYLLQKTKDFIVEVCSPTGEKISDGIVVSEEGYILTSLSKLKNKNYASIFIKNKHYPAIIAGYIKKYDIAIFKLKKMPPILSKVSIGQKEIKIGDIIFGISHKTIIKGMTSFKKNNLFFCDINPSISQHLIGIFNDKAHLIGIKVADKNKDQLSSFVSGKLINPILSKKIIDFKKINLFFGMSISNLDQELYAFYGTNQGVVIIYADDNKSSHQAGLKRGDLIVLANKKNISNFKDFVKIAQKYSKDDNLSITYIRNKLHKKTFLKYQDIDTSLLNPNSIFFKGMLVEKLDNKMKTLLNVPKEISGVYVISVDFNSSSYNAGVKMGDVIFQIDNKTITNSDNIKPYKKHESRKHKFFLYRKGWNSTRYF